MAAAVARRLAGSTEDGSAPAQDDLELSLGPIVALGPYYKLICKRLTKHNTSERVDTLFVNQVTPSVY